ncbi:arylamine N-acetyltransferase family protein [Streptomyces flavofungini]|uniref:Arylamine N-acetyltransferase n=1 Tax=Streptomyces flavofungini TaxID=68200 RepID=A0ABS0XA97_9ACTN|nr:arylamine N-acetyltransferase [Streptomyces flavofungini]MBJ3810113.1 arylamine N-acetyltransferase [Streptomyces flavofungini]GHC81640.1 arylamine N-acetyltransferase [Streptomyces flavofungini]
MTWNGEELDVEAYLARIGYEGEAKPDLETLRALHRAHVASIPFENLEIMLGRPVPLDLAALQDKLVRRRRGGYCYEQNLLFAAALERIGFSVTGRGARVRAGASTTRAVSHMLLNVEADGEQWHCDVGFGADGLLEPILMREGVDVRQGEWRFSIASEPEGVRVLRTENSNGWFDLYAYTPAQCLPVDYVVMNHYTSTHPKSSFIRRPVLQRAAPEVRRRLTGAQLTLTRPDGSSGERDVPVSELRDTIVREFGVELGDDDFAELIRVHYAGA